MGSAMSDLVLDPRIPEHDQQRLLKVPLDDLIAFSAPTPQWPEFRWIGKLLDLVEEVNKSSSGRPGQSPRPWARRRVAFGFLAPVGVTSAGAAASMVLLAILLFDFGQWKFASLAVVAAS